MVVNVPLNDALASVQAQTPDAVAFWARYLRVWTTWNHVRTVAAIAAALVFVLALRRAQLAGIAAGS